MCPLAIAMSSCASADVRGGQNILNTPRRDESVESGRISEAPIRRDVNEHIIHESIQLDIEGINQHTRPVLAGWVA